MVLEGDAEIVIKSLQNEEASFSAFGHILQDTKSIIGCLKYYSFYDVRK